MIGQEPKPGDRVVVLTAEVRMLAFLQGIDSSDLTRWANQEHWTEDKLMWMLSAQDRMAQRVP